MSTPTPIFDTADPRWAELEAFQAVHSGSEAISDLTPEERAKAHDYFVRGIGQEDRDGLPGDMDASLTVVALLRIFNGAQVAPDDPTGDAAIARLLARFDGREFLLFEAAMNYVQFLGWKFGASGDQGIITEYLQSLSGAEQ